MNDTIFLVDLDGVVVHRADYFSVRAKELYPHANHEAIKEFFVGGKYKETTLGKTDLVSALNEVIEGWDTGKSTAELLAEWFAGENQVDDAVLAYIQTLREKGVRCIIATDHSKFRRDDVWNNLHMNEYFDDIIASADIGATKEEPKFYTKAMELFGVEDPSTMYFTDDDPENVEVAKSVGVKASTFTGIESLQEIEGFKRES